MSLPYGMDPSELKPGSMRSMTSDKLASFSLGGTKKTAFQKHKEMLEAKRKQQEDATAVEMAKWVEEFEGGGDNQKQFVRGGVIQQGETADRSGGGAGSSSRGGAPPSRQPPMLQRPPQRRRRERRKRTRPSSRARRVTRRDDSTRAFLFVLERSCRCPRFFFSEMHHARLTRPPPPQNCSDRPESLWRGSLHHIDDDPDV